MSAPGTAACLAGALAAVAFACWRNVGLESRGSILAFDWLDDHAHLHRDPEQRAWNPEDLIGPWSFGRHPWIHTVAARPFIWSHLQETRFSIEVMHATGRTLVLDGFPAPSPDGLPQRVDATIDDRSIGTAEFSRAQRVALPVPDGILAPGRHRITLHYRYTVDAAGGGRGSEQHGMAWHRVELQRTGAPPEHGAGPESTTQTASSVWWRTVPTSSPVAVRASGRSLADDTTVALWIDAGSGLWTELDREVAPAGAPIRFERTLPHAPGTVVRLGMATLRGAVDWEELGTRVLCASDRPPVVLVTLDTTRRDALGCYAAGMHTPHLDRLAAAGVVWDQAYTPTPATGPAHASLFLSRDPAAHGLRNNGQSLPRATGGNLAVQLQALGYDTAAFVSLGTVAADLGFAQGFDVFDDACDQGWWRFAAQVNVRALPWIAAHPQGDGRPPGFLWVHYSDPHRPYGTADEPGQGIVIELNGTEVARAPTLGLEQRWQVAVAPGRNVVTLRAAGRFEDARRHWYILRDFTIDDDAMHIATGEGWKTVRQFPRMRDLATLVIDSSHDATRPATLTLRVEDNPTAAEARRRYDAEVTAMDAALGDLIAELDTAGWLDRGLLMIVGDHGEDLGENGHFGHIHHVGPTLTHVPMLLWQRGLQPARSQALVGLIDVAPTLFARLNLPPSPQWTGVDALHAPAGRHLSLETFPPEADQHVRGVVEPPLLLWGLVDAGPEATVVIDVSKAPPRGLPIRALPASEARRVAALRKAWDSWTPSGPAAPGVPSEVVERLRALGYLQ